MLPAGLIRRWAAHIIRRSHIDWKLWEQQWYAKASTQLEEYVSLAMEVHDFVEHVATHDGIVSPKPTPTRSLERHLMRRLGEEYRAVDLLATSGHGFQTMSTCASLFELAHTLGYIVNNDNAVAEWFASENRERIPWAVRTLVNRNGHNLGWDKARCDEQYARYGFLCGFKHNNPVFARVSNLPIDPDLYLAQFGLAEGANLALVGVSLVAVFRLDGEQCSTTLQVSNALFDRAAAALPRINDLLP